MNIGRLLVLKLSNVVNSSGGKSSNTKNREIDEYRINDPIAIYNPETVKEAISKVMLFYSI